ncbi:putative FMN/FAD exporter YeeO [subsurface metagenome]
MEEVGGSAGRGGAFDRDWTKGSLIRNLLSLSWPMMITQSLYVVGMTVDMVWVGRLGAAPIAGVGIAGIIINLVVSGVIGLTVGVRAMIARFVGAGDTEGASNVGRQALVISAVYGVVVTAAGFFFAELTLKLFGLEADVVAQGAVYLRICSLAWIPLSFYMMAFNIMQASGDTVTPMRIIIFMRSVHVLLAPFLILGWWVFPRLGVSGAGITYGISMSLGMLLALWVLFSGRSRLQLSLRNFRLDLNIIWRIVKIDIPACVMSAQMSLGHLALAWFVIPFGTLAVAAHSLVQRVEMLLFMPGMGLGTGAGVLVGQNLGASQPERAERSGWLAVGLVEGFMVVCSVAVVLWAESIIRIFSPEPELVEVASTFLRIAAAGYLFLGFTAVLQNCISGAGDTMPPMLFALVIMWLVQLPLAFLLSQVTNLGVYGVRWAIVAGMLVGAIAYIIYFRLGRWKRKKV